MKLYLIYYDVVFSQPGAVVRPKGWAVRPLKRNMRWVRSELNFLKKFNYMRGPLQKMKLTFKVSFNNLNFSKHFVNVKKVHTWRQSAGNYGQPTAQKATLGGQP